MLPAVELISVPAQADDDPSFYWSAVTRVLADITAPGAADDALAKLLFGRSCLGGILLHQLAECSGEDSSSLLSAIHTTYLGGEDPDVP